MMRSIVWLKVMTLAGSFGMALGIAPYLVVGVLKEDSPTPGTEELKALAALFILPSVCVWMAMAPGLNNKDVTSGIGRGLAWPFLTLLIGTSLNKIFSFDPDFHAHVGFILWTLVIPLGVIAGVVMHRVVNAHYIAIE
jgi:hypothetical protein